jgi:hypothetical protein
VSALLIDRLLRLFERGNPNGTGTLLDGNPIHGLLTAAGVPWQSTRQDLADRFGIRKHPAYGWDVIEIATAKPLVDHLLWPPSVQVMPQFSPRLPAVEFTSETSVGDNSRDNLRRTARQLEGQLGKARIVERYNTMECRWTSGAATLGLTVWPQDLQHEGWAGHIPAHEREPRLATACHLRIDTGFQLAATAQELVWLNSFVPLGNIVIDGVRGREYELEYVRAPVAGLPPLSQRVGHSADHGALIFCHSGSLYLVPLADVIGFRVERLLPAKGSGGSWLMVDCRTNFESLATKTLSISTAPGADDLNALAAKLAEATGKPLVLGEYGSDC